MIIRIPLDETNSRVTPRYADNQGNDYVSAGDDPGAFEETTTGSVGEGEGGFSQNGGGKGGAGENDGGAGGSGENGSGEGGSGQNGGAPMTLPEIDFSLEAVDLEDYSSSQLQFPSTAINVTVPDDDKSTVTSWFGNPTGNQSVSDTLVRRMTSAVTGAIETLQNDAAREGLFTRPFRLGYALLTADGKLIHGSTPVTLFPNEQAPVMAIREVSLSANQLNTRTEIRNRTCRLSATIPAFSIPPEIRSRVTHLVFYATQQCEFLTGDEQVTAVRTYVIDNHNCPGWYYPRMSADLVRARAERATGFRIIGRVDISEAEAGVGYLALPAPGTDLTDWNSFPKAENVPDPANSDNPDNPGRPEPTHLELVTSPLDLGLPEADKRVLSLTARGIFSRHPDSVTTVLYGAHHRPADDLTGWRKIATARGPHIRLLRGVRYRWLKVAVTLPYPSRVDALTFLLK